MQRSKDSRARLTALALVAAAAPWDGAAGEGNAETGREISIRLCSRCHVIGDYNPMGGIGSTPSFQAMTFLKDYVERMETFYARRPHQAFVRAPGSDEPLDSAAYVPERTVTPAEIDDIVAFLKTLAQP